MSLRQRRTVDIMATELIGMLDGLPNIQNATPEQIESLATMSRRRFCLLYFKSVCVFLILLIVVLVSWKMDESMSIFDGLFNFLSLNTTQALLSTSHL